MADTKRNDQETGGQWRSEGERERKPAWFPGEHELGDTWLQLQYAHTAVRPVDPAVRTDLLESYFELERLCLAHPGLERYYRESFLSEGRSDVPGETSDAEWHFATMQLRLAEYVFKVLQLARFANAPPNRGWMVLFRRWGRTPLFDSVVTRASPTLRADFFAFYRWYLRGYSLSSEGQAVPHPWDSLARRLDSRVSEHIARDAPDQQTWRAVDAMVEYLPGCFLDSGFQDVRPRRVVGDRSAPVARGLVGEQVPSAEFDDEGYLRAFAPEALSERPPDQDQPPPSAKE